MKICVVSHEFPPIGGGAGNVCSQITEGYIQQGFEVSVLTMQCGDQALFEERNGIKIYRVQCGRKRKDRTTTPEMLRYILKGRKQIKKLILEKKVEVIHNHFLLPAGPISYYANKNFGIPFINTSHGTDIPGHNQGSFKLLHQITPPFLKKIANASCGNFCGSDHLANLANDLLKPRNPYRVIREGFDANFARDLPKKKIILSSGRLLDFKGFPQLIEAVSTIENDWELHIAGDGKMKSRYEEMGKKSKMPVVFHGWLDNKGTAYRKLVSEASIFSLVSENENANVAILEAMSTGCAIISSSHPGCKESLGEAGIIVPAKNVKSLNKALSSLMESVSRRDELGKLAKQRIENFSWSKCHSAYETALKRAIFSRETS